MRRSTVVEAPSVRHRQPLRMTSTQVVRVRIAFRDQLVEPHVGMLIVVGQRDGRPLGATRPGAVPAIPNDPWRESVRAGAVRRVDGQVGGRCRHGAPTATWQAARTRVACIHEQPASTPTSAPAGARPLGSSAAPTPIESPPTAGRAIRLPPSGSGPRTRAAGRSGPSGCSSACWQPPFSFRACGRSDSGESLTYTEWRTQVEDGQIATAEINTGSGKITGEFANGDSYSTTGGGERGVSEADEQLMIEQNVDYEFKPPSNNWLLSMLSIFLPVMLIIGFFIWMQRRASGQMGNVMSIGRARRRRTTPTSRRPRSTTSPATPA